MGASRASAWFGLLAAIATAACLRGRDTIAPPRARTPPPASASAAAPVPGARVAARVVPAWEGLFHTCVVRPPGRVFCWGANNDGELGDGTREDRYTPVRAGALEDAVQVSAGLGETCALRRTGAVRCWGDAADAAGLEHDVAGVSDAVQVSAGAGYACALTRDGAVLCWGTVCAPCPAGGAAVDPLQGGCGSRYHCRMASARPVAPVPGVHHAVQVSVGGSLTGNEHDGSWHVLRPCAVIEDGAVLCWDPVAPAPRALRGIPPAAQVATRGEHGVVLARSGEVFAWSGEGEPRPVAGVRDAVQVSAGWSRSCAVLAGGDVVCWTPAASVPERVAGLADVRAVLAASHYQCAMLASGEVRCWGGSARGWLGSGRRDEQVRPVRVALPARAVELDAGSAYTCARLSDGRVACWGTRSVGVLGRGDAPELSEGSSAEALPVLDVVDARALSVGAYHACVLRADGRFTCWGGNHTRAFGAPPYDFQSRPVDGPALPGLRAIAAGVHRTCVALATGEVRCAGDDAGTFHPMSGLSSAAAPSRLATGERFACVCDARGALRCSERFAAARADRCVDVAATSGRVCALLAGGRVRCWRDREAPASGRWVVAPEAMTVVPGAVEIAAGEDFECVRTADGAVQCRGENSHGELGDGTLASRRTFAPVAGLRAVASIALGDSHACARDADGAVWCWGDNHASQAAVEPIPAVPLPVVFP